MATKKELMKACTKVRDNGETALRIQTSGFAHIMTIDSEAQVSRSVNLDRQCRTITFDATDRVQGQTDRFTLVLTRTQVAYLGDWLDETFWPELSS